MKSAIGFYRKIYLRTNIKPGLITLALGGLTIGMTEFMMMGLLPDISKTLDISIPTAGHLISIYALGVVVGAPLMTFLSAAYQPRKVLMMLMLMFTLFNTLFALAPGFETLLIARFFAGLPHGAFFGIGAVVASKLAEPGREARSIAVMFSGLTLANIIGVPLGTYLGHNYSWRFSFFLIALVAFLAAASIRYWMPDTNTQGRDQFKAGFSVFKKTNFWLILLITAIGTGGLFAWISYIAPLMTEVAGFNANSVSMIMIIAGVGMAVGNFLGGMLADRFSPTKAVAALLVTMTITLILVALFSHYKPIALVLTFVTGAVAFAIAPSIQMLMINTAKGAEMLASSMIQASFNVGNTLGAFLGGLPIAAGFGYRSPEYVGALMAFGGFVICSILMRRLRARTP
ncbi:MFS transporter [Pollutibacter soli]|uniref:MFS transporter n=1 Tax=Pollutibacter soli TaxID=3034157 RepID=UPI00301407D6